MNKPTPVREASSKGQVEMVMNWFDELRRRVPVGCK
jgi:hypothetical protein